MVDMSELYARSATDVLAAFRDRVLSPVEYFDAIIARYQIAQPIVNAFGDTYFDEAREQALAAEARYGGAGAPPRALEGLPVAVN